MDEQGVEAAWLFPSQGVCMEGPMQPDIEASIEMLRAFNRWLDEDWGFAYQDRIFAVPFLTLSDLDRAVDELEWCLDRGARVITIRNGPVFTPEGIRSPADRCSTRSGPGCRGRASSWPRTPASRTATSSRRRHRPDVGPGRRAGKASSRPDASAVQSASLVGPCS